MNNQVQPVQSTGQTQSPRLQLSDNTNNLFNANPSDLDFHFDEKSGSFMMDFKKPQQANQPTDTANKEQQANSQQQPAHEFEDRFSRIESAIINLAGVMQGIQMNPSQQQQSQVTQESQQPNLDINSDDFAINLTNLINQVMDKRFSAFEDKLKPLNEKVANVDKRFGQMDLVTKYGKDFVDKYPLIQQYKSVDPNANEEALYLMLSKLSPKDGNTQSTNGSTPNGQPQVDLVQRAEQLSTVRDGVPNVAAPQQQNGKMTINQAVEQSIKELYG